MRGAPDAQRVAYLTGDVGTAAGARALVAAIIADAAAHGRFDFLVVSAAIFPDWAGAWASRIHATRGR